MRLALAQINSVVGDLTGNAERILGRLDEAKEQSVDVVLFPELIVTGYPICSSAPGSSGPPRAPSRRSHARAAASPR